MSNQRNIYRMILFILWMALAQRTQSARNPFQQDEINNAIPSKTSKELVGQLQTQSKSWRVYRVGSRYQIETNHVR